MIWQDLLIMCGGFVLAASLIPTVLHKNKPPIITTLPLTIILASYGIAFASLGLWLSTVAVLLQSVLWGVMVIQRWRNCGTLP
jgi:hypothetical protein